MSGRLMRSSLYVGGTSPARMIQAGFLEADCLVYDLEDSVPAGEKDAARFLVCSAITYQRPADKTVIVRVNGLYSKELEEDLKAVVRARPDAIRIPKTETEEEVRRIDGQITELEEKEGIPVGSIRLWCNIESWKGLLNAREIACASPRIEALALGAEDFTASIGAKRTREGTEILYARSMMVLACREAGISAQDAVFSDIRDPEGFAKDLETARTLGFDGKTCIHPSQVRPVNACFTPSPREIQQAKRVIDALKKAEKDHTGVCLLDGSMVDRPMALRARMILDRAAAAGCLRGETENDA